MSTKQHRIVIVTLPLEKTADAILVVNIVRVVLTEIYKWSNNY